MHHQHHFLSSWQVQNNLNAPKIQAVATEWLCYCEAERYPGCEDNPCHTQCWMLDRKQIDQILSPSYTLLPHSTSIPKSSDHHLTWPDWDTPTTTTGFGKLDEKLMASEPHAEDSSEKWCQFKIITETAKLSWVLRNMNIKIGLKRIMSVSLSCYMQRTRPMWSGKITQAPNPREANLDISEDKPRRDCAR